MREQEGRAEEEGNGVRGGVTEREGKEKEKEIMGGEGRKIRGVWPQLQLLDPRVTLMMVTQ